MDELIQANIEGGALTGLVCSSTNLSEEARIRHELSPLSACILGRALTLAALLGGLLKSGQSVSMQVISSGPARGFYAQADGLGGVRGSIQESSLPTWLTPEGKLDVPRAIGHGHLYVLKDLGLKEPYLGTVELISGGLASDLAYYFAQSEQIPTACGCGVFIDKNGRVQAAGGFLIQVTAGAQESLLARLEENIRLLSPVSSLLLKGAKPEKIFELITGPFSFEINRKTNLSFRCRCSRERAKQALVILGKEELRDILLKEKEAEVRCNFCNELYIFREAELYQILEEVKNLI